MQIYHAILSALRKAYLYFFKQTKTLPPCETDVEIASELIYDKLITGRPVMIARYGSTELANVINYIGVANPSHNPFKYISNRQPQWWWNPSLHAQLAQWSGFFPATEENVMSFCELMMRDASEVDVLGSWLSQEKTMIPYMKEAGFVHLHLLEPFWSKNPWTRALKGKRVLVVHPFADTIRAQYARRAKLFSNPDILPEFATLSIIPAVQSIGGQNDRFNDWFQALEWMKNEIDNQTYDICLIGCGAYGFPLAAHVKRQGKQAIHLGGALQLLFGIKGKRWEDPNYGVKEWGLPKGLYSELCNNPFWVRPMGDETPSTANKVENGCYW